MSRHWPCFVRYSMYWQRRELQSKILSISQSDSDPTLALLRASPRVLPPTGAAIKDFVYHSVCLSDSIQALARLRASQRVPLPAGAATENWNYRSVSQSDSVSRSALSCMSWSLCAIMLCAHHASALVLVIPSSPASIHDNFRFSSRSYTKIFTGCLLVDVVRKLACTCPLRVHDDTHQLAPAGTAVSELLLLHCHCCCEL